MKKFMALLMILSAVLSSTICTLQVKSQNELPPELKELQNNINSLLRNMFGFLLRLANNGSQARVAPSSTPLNTLLEELQDH